MDSDEITKLIQGWLDWENAQFGTGMFRLPDPVVGFMRILLIETDEIRKHLKDIAGELDYVGK